MQNTLDFRFILWEQKQAKLCWIYPQEEVSSSVWQEGSRPWPDWHSEHDLAAPTLKPFGACYGIRLKPWSQYSYYCMLCLTCYMIYVSLNNSKILHQLCSIVWLSLSDGSYQIAIKCARISTRWLSTSNYNSSTNKVKSSWDWTLTNFTSIHIS